VVRKLWGGKIVCFEVTFEEVKWWRYFNGGRYMTPDLRSRRWKSTTSEIGFYPGNLEERKLTHTHKFYESGVPNSIKLQLFDDW